MSSSWARSLSVDLLTRSDLVAISVGDVRFGPLVRALEPGARYLRDALASILATRALDQRLEAALATLWAALDRASQIPIEDELEDIVRAAGVTNRRPVLRYLGWDGAGGSTLQVAAEELGLSRERVRQLADKVKKKTNEVTYAPAVDRALAHVSTLSGQADAIERSLVEAGLARAPFRLEGLLLAASLLGRPCAQSLAAVGANRLLLDIASADRIRLIRDVARRLVDRWGVTTVTEVEAQVSSRASDGSGLDVGPVLQALPGFSWLDHDGGWFWFAGDTGWNRLLNQMRKIMCVSQRVRLGELRAGLGRHYRMQGFTPPKRVLAALVSAHDSYALEGEVVVAERSLDCTSVLASSEETIVSNLRVMGGVARREDLEERCIAAGMNRSTFYVYLSYTPVLTRLAPGVYGLRGATIQPGVVEALGIRKPKGKVLQDYGWTQSGAIWIGYRLTPSTITSGVVSIPASMATFIGPEYSLVDAQGVQLGRLGSNANSAWGLSSLISRRSLEAGDYLQLTLDLQERIAQAKWGPEPPWELPQMSGAEVEDFPTAD